MSSTERGCFGPHEFDYSDSEISFCLRNVSKYSDEGCSVKC